MIFYWNFATKGLDLFKRQDRVTAYLLIPPFVSKARTFPLAFPNSGLYLLDFSKSNIN